MLPLLLAAALNFPVIIDTDCGVDDMMAIAYLLAQPAINIEAITVANGLAHVDKGAQNVLRLLEQAGRPEIPVYIGRGKPLSGSAEFPKAWRDTSDNPPLPPAKGAPRNQSAAAFLQQRLKEIKRPVIILALGPLTNLAEALEGSKTAAKVVQNLVIMGGAVRVQGNLPDGEFFKTDNITAEWNFYIDPQAAERVFNAGLPIRLVPLDATSRVPIGPEFLAELEQMQRNKFGDTVLAILRTEKDLVDKGIYQAWDPLAAVALVDPRVVVWENLTIRIKKEKPEEGRSQLSPGLNHNAKVGVGARPEMFKDLFFEPLRAPSGTQ